MIFALLAPGLSLTPCLDPVQLEASVSPDWRFLETEVSWGLQSYPVQCWSQTEQQYTSVELIVLVAGLCLLTYLSLAPATAIVQAGSRGQPGLLLWDSSFWGAYLVDFS